MKVTQFTFRITRYWNFFIDRKPNFLLWGDSYPENTREEDRPNYKTDCFNLKFAWYRGEILRPKEWRGWLTSTEHRKLLYGSRPFLSVGIGNIGVYIGWKVYGFVEEYFNWYQDGWVDKKYMCFSASIRLRHRRD